MWQLGNSDSFPQRELDQVALAQCLASAEQREAPACSASIQPRKVLHTMRRVDAEHGSHSTPERTTKTLFPEPAYEASKCNDDACDACAEIMMLKHSAQRGIATTRNGSLDECRQAVAKVMGEAFITATKVAIGWRRRGPHSANARLRRQLRERVGKFRRRAETLRWLRIEAALDDLLKLNGDILAECAERPGKQVLWLWCH